MKKIVVFLEVLTFLLCINVNGKCLSDLDVTGYSLVPSFNTNTYKYNVFINGNSISIKGKTNTKFEIEGLGNFDVTKNNEIYNIKCNNEIYKINVIKNSNQVESDNAYLEELFIDGVDISFDKDTFYYEIDRIDNINLHYEVENSLSVVEEIEEDNRIILNVTSYDKTKTNTYIIKINDLETVSNIKKNKINTKEFNNYQKCGAILVVGFILLTVVHFIRKLLFK